MGEHPVLDFHARLAPGPGSAGRLIAIMDEHGIDRAAVCAGGLADPYRLSEQIVRGGWVEADADNAAVLGTCRRSGGRLVPFFFGNPRRDPRLYKDNAADFRGLEISPAMHGVALTDQRTAALVVLAGEFGHPVYVVCLGRAGSGVADLVTLADQFPEVTFVLGHCGFIGIDFYAIDAIAASRNILAETSGCYTSVAAAALNRLGPDRVLFGTEYPGQHPSVELAKFRSLGVPADTWRLVAWDNARRLLGEEA
jgi:predicted TIM-barrel fold metal-dependent hydrolase